MTCIGAKPPTNSDEFFGLIERCALAAIEEPKP